MNEKQQKIEKIRTLVNEFLRLKKGQRFSIFQLYNEICKHESINLSYPAFINYIEMMASYGDFKLEDYKSVKLVVYEGEKNEKRN